MPRSHIRRYGGNRLPATKWANASYRTGNALVALRFDDGHDVDYTYTFGQLTSRGLIGGFSVISDLIDGSGHLTLAQILEMQAAGMEIMCHSKTHGADPTTSEEFIAETQGAVRTMRALGLDVTNFVTPGTWVVTNAYRCIDATWYGTAADAVLRKNFYAFQAYYQGYWDNSYRFNLPLDPVKRWGIDYADYSGGSYTLPQMKLAVDACINEQRGMLILTHAWALDGVGNTTKADWEAWLDYLALRIAKGYVTLVTPTQFQYAQPDGVALQHFLFNLDQETGALDQWTSNSDAVHLTCAAGAALNSTVYGLSVNITSTTSFYVSKTITPNTTGKVRVRFYLDPNTLTMATGDNFGVVGVYSSTSSNHLCSIFLSKSASSYQIKGYYNYDTGNTTTATHNITDAPHYIEFYETRATTDVSSDGTITFWIDGVHDAALDVTGLDNYHRFDNFSILRAGATQAIDAGTSGVFYIDEIVANDTGTAIGA